MFKNIFGKVILWYSFSRVLKLRFPCPNVFALSCVRPSRKENLHEINRSSMSPEVKPRRVAS